jgi:hypothetical protein
VAVDQLKEVEAAVRFFRDGRLPDAVRWTVS